MAVKAVLGISLGTRSLGIAIFRNDSLYDWKVHTFPGEWSQQKAERIMQTIHAVISRNSIQRIFIKIPDIFPNSTGFNQLVGCLNLLCEKRDVKFEYYTLSDIKKHFVRDREITMQELFECIVSTHPELCLEYRKEKSNRNKYYHKAFEAIAAAMIGK